MKKHNQLASLAKFTHDNSPPYKCRSCSFTTDSQMAIMVHWNRKHGPKAKSWTRNVTKAQRSRSGNGAVLEIKEMMCPEPGCGYTTDKDVNMRAHERRVHGLSRRSPVVAASPAVAKRPEARPAVRFCPECGCNIVAVTMAMEMAKRA